MIFNSYVFILLFLPLTVALYYALGDGKRGARRQNILLAGASLCFYGYWNVVYVPLLLASILVNFGTGRMLLERGGSSEWRKVWLAGGICFNLGLLGYFKYADFFIETINDLIGSNIALLHVMLPLAISFFTFQQIAFLSDCYRRSVAPGSFLEYLVFVVFFPQLIAGPIVHHAEMMPQFFDHLRKRIDWENMSLGAYMFSMGLFKKVIVADTLATWVTTGYSDVSSLNLLSSWAVTLSYTFQIYFDFSGYMDMAHGCARMFNIRLPRNFDSPYKALSIQDFWRRWHRTLSRFLRDYLYIPLGGNRGSRVRTVRNIMITFLLGGIWHGAGWTFLIWGGLHGAGLAAQRIWQRLAMPVPKPLSWLLTFLFVHVAWVFFRAQDVGTAWKVIRTMFGMEKLVVSKAATDALSSLVPYGLTFDDPLKGLAEIDILYWLGACFLVVALPRNSNQLADIFTPSYPRLAFSTALFSYSMLHLNRVSEFIYFQF